MRANILKALVLYDYLLTYAEERKLIWQRKFSISTVLYLATRYVSIMENVALVVQIARQTYSGGGSIDIVRDYSNPAAVMVLMKLFYRCKVTDRLVML